MTWTAVESKMFSAVAYEPSGKTLYLRFRRGDVYCYFDFPANEYETFLAAESKGRFFLSEIRDCFHYERLARLQTV
jgi:hypothetical protein